VLFASADEDRYPKSLRQVTTEGFYR